MDLEFINAKSRTEHGTEVASFYPGDRLVVCSFSEELEAARAAYIIKLAVRELAKIEVGRSGVTSRTRSVSAHAYLDKNLTHIVITRRVDTIRKAKYRGDAKFSNAFKPSGKKSEESVLYSVAFDE